MARAQFRSDENQKRADLIMTELIECYDAGGTNIRGALIDKINHKNIVALKTCNTARGNPKRFIEQIVGLSSLLRKAMSPTDKVIAISVGLPGPVDKGILLGSAPMQIRSTFDVTSELRKHFSEPVYVENDLKTAVRAELDLGIGRQVKNFYLLTISTGIGVGIVVGGRAISSGMSGEFGHCILERDARKANKCGCGRYGCWGAMSSGYGIELTARKELGRKLSVKEFFDIYEKGDQKAKTIVEKIRDYNAHGIGNMLNAFCVDVIVVMGSVGLKQFERIIPSKKEIRKYTVNKIPKIIKTKLGDTIGLLGAYMIAREKNLGR